MRGCRCCGAGDIWLARLFRSHAWRPLLIKTCRLTIQEQRARNDNIQAEIQKVLVEHQKIISDTLRVEQETRFAPFTLLATGAGAAAALMGAGAALVKLLG